MTDSRTSPPAWRAPQAIARAGAS